MANDTNNTRGQHSRTQLVCVAKQHANRHHLSTKEPPASVALHLGISIHCLLLLLLLATTTQLANSSAVVRPTIFKSDSDQPQQQQQTSTNALVASQAAPNNIQIQAPQQQQAQSAPTSTTNNNNNNNQGQLTQVSQAQPLAAPAPIGGHQHHLQQHHHPHQLVATAAADAQKQQQAPLVGQNQRIQPIKSRFCSNSNGLQTDAPLGLESYAIDDFALSASSFSNEQVRPHLARLNQDLLGGAWCPMKPISNSNFGKEWIQVKLNRSFVISAIETQGRFGLGSGKEFAPSYSVEYSRNNGLTWHRWKDFHGLHLLRANDDVNTPVRNELSPPIVGANVIRLVPHSQHLRTVCMRFELHGCQYDEGAPMSYAMLDGVVEPRWGYFIDYAYDGQRSRGQLTNGLGQLVDGAKGADNFSFNSGFEWVGWKSMNGDVVIEFTFKTLRNFTGALFHSNNLFSSGVEVFQGVDVHYGIDVGLSQEALKDALQEQQRRRSGWPAAAAAAAGASTPTPDQAPWLAAGGDSTPATNQQQQQQPAATLWSPDMLSIEYEPDKKAESSRPVTVHLKQRLANKLRFVLKFASKWILVSEVEFLSHPVELLSLASLHEQLTPQLMGALAPAKTYDEYVAILREHQLRRIVADIYLGSFGAGSSSSLPPPSAEQPQDAPTTTDAAPPPPASTLGDDLDSAYNSNEQQQQHARRVVAGPAIPTNSSTTNTNYNWLQQANLANEYHPSTNAQFNANNNNNNNPLAPSTVFGSPASGDLATLPGGAILLNNGLNQLQQESLADNQLQQQQSGGAASKRTLGVVSIVSLIMLVIVISGLSFALSSYKLRHQPARSKLGSGAGSSASAAAARNGQWYSPASKKSLFMSNVLGSVTGGVGATGGQLQRSHLAPISHHQLRHHHQTLASSSNNGSADSHYNPLFAPSTGRSSDAGSLSRRASGGGGPLSTLKRLASLGGGGGKQVATNQHLFSNNCNNNLLFNNQAQSSSSSNQLLVSLKDPNSSSSQQKLLISSGNGPQSTISTQLIIGLNQANPLNQQQQQQHLQQNNIYNGNQTYATHYSASMASGGSSSLATNVGQMGADYANSDYAIPEASGQQPLISHSNNNNNNTNFRQQQFQHHHHHQFQPGTEMRASHRLLNHPHNQIIMQQQQQQQQRLLASEHNYELIYGDQQPQVASQLIPTTLATNNNNSTNATNQRQQQQQHHTLLHSDRLGGDPLNCHLPPLQLNSMTMSNHHNHQQLIRAKQQQQQQQQQQQSSPGHSSASGQTTTTTASDNSHYYYSSTEAAKNCQLDKKA